MTYRVMLIVLVLLAFVAGTADAAEVGKAPAQGQWMAMLLAFGLAVCLSVSFVSSRRNHRD